MADLIYFHGVVKGPRNACRAFLGALPKTDEPDWREIRKDGEEYLVVFKCETKGPTWRIDQSEKELSQRSIPEDLRDAFNFGQRYFANPPADISKILGVAFVVWDEWENYWAYDHGTWLDGPLADQLEQQYVSPRKPVYLYTNGDKKRRFDELKLNWSKPNEQEIEQIIESVLMHLESYPDSWSGANQLQADSLSAESLLPGDPVVMESAWRLDGRSPVIDFSFRCLDGTKFDEIDTYVTTSYKDLDGFLPCQEVIGNEIDDLNGRTPDDLTRDDIYWDALCSCALPFLRATVQAITPASLRSKQYNSAKATVSLTCTPVDAADVAKFVKKFLSTPIRERKSVSVVVSEVAHG